MTIILLLVAFILLLAAFLQVFFFFSERMRKLAYQQRTLISHMIEEGKNPKRRPDRLFLSKFLDLQENYKRYEEMVFITGLSSILIAIIGVVIEIFFTDSFVTWKAMAYLILELHGVILITFFHLNSNLSNLYTALISKGKS